MHLSKNFSCCNLRIVTFSHGIHFISQMFITTSRQCLKLHSSWKFTDLWIGYTNIKTNTVKSNNFVGANFPVLSIFQKFMGILIL